MKLPKSKNFAILQYAMGLLLIVAFSAIASVILYSFKPQFALMGVLAGGTLGAVLAVHEYTVYGCVAGMLLGFLIAPIFFFAVDLETAGLALFICSLMGAILGEPARAFFMPETYEEHNSKYSNKTPKKLKDATEATASSQTLER